MFLHWLQPEKKLNTLWIRNTKFKSSNMNFNYSMAIKGDYKKETCKHPMESINDKDTNLTIVF